ncbi:MAG: TrlF family AAA-like ATPase [Methanobacteriaceae archaeon]
MIEIGYSRKGSQWRKWDLHLHSPSSYDYKNKSMTNDEIINNLKINDVSAAVITDHHKIDVERVNELIKLGNKEKILILPGIEFRSELGKSGDPVHYIGIFDNNNVKKIWDIIRVELRKYLPENDDKKSNDEAYVPLAKGCEIIRENGGISTIHAGTKSNSIELLKNHSSKFKLKEDITENHIDILEIGKKEDINSIYEDIVFKSINRRMPIVKGSDNHDIGKYQLKNSCWIKGDLTFEGLKQILCEFDDRISIKETKPDIKNNYEVIDSISFNDENFTEDQINFNDNLVSIIGSKSTGKSILLRSIANAIDKEQVDEKFGGTNKLKDPRVSVIWNDGDKYSFPDESGDATKKRIMYIPQGYLNRSVDSENPNSFANKIIKNILKKDNKFQIIFDKFDSTKAKYENEIHEKINRLFDNINRINEKIHEFKDLGDIDDIQNGIINLKNEIGNLSNEKVNEEDEKLQNELNEKIRNIKKEIYNQTENYNVLENLIEDMGSSNSLFRLNNIEELNDENVKEEINETLKIYNFISKDSVLKKLEAELAKIAKMYDVLSNKCGKYKTDLKALNDKIKLSESTKEKFDKINIEEQRIENIKSKKEELKNLRKNCKEILEDIYLFNKKFFENSEKITGEFRFEGSQSIFRVESKFNTKLFNTKFDKLNKRYFNDFEKEENINLSDFVYETETFHEQLKKIVNGILVGELITKKNISKKEIIQMLFESYIFINFDIIDGGDTLEEMSPGKRSFALLKVLISLDKSKWPILIDQPEDDLDSKSISKDLIKFLKETKKERQIIIVSHNPNLVVGADSEQVIVANQDGVDVTNKNKKFEYVSGSIENTFKNENEECYLYSKGIKEYVCDILEGGEESFKKRQAKYNIH